MIYLIIGNNAYRAEQEIARIIKTADIMPERFDAAALDDNALADIMRGASLFAEKRLVIIRELSERKELWEKTSAWVSTVSDDTTLVLVETKPDRRTKAYKTLAKQATIVQAPSWTERDHGLAEEWLRKLVSQRGAKVSPAQVVDMVARAMVPAERGMTIDQFQLAHAVEALSVLDTATDDAIATVLPAAMTDVLFELLGYAANRDTVRVNAALADLHLSEDPYKVFSMLAAEWARLVAVAVADGPSASIIAVELGIHPFVAQKLQRLTGQFTRTQLHDLTVLATDIDAGMKLSQFAPWDGVDRFVLGVAHRA